MEEISRHQVNISGGQIQGFIQENNGTVNQYFISQVSDLISKPSVEAKQFTQAEYRQRRVLLSKVRDYWIKGVLEQSLSLQGSIALDLEKREDAIINPFGDLAESLPEAREEQATLSNASEIFDAIGEGRTLLVLGDPGSGKTITLLKLAQELLSRAEENPDALIPTVFNLSSWDSPKLSIENWLIGELFSKYQVPKEVGKNWIKDQQLIILLDGLDEVKSNLQESCVDAINAFTNQYGQTEIVVCSRSIDYGMLSNKLQLRGAIYIRALTPQQIHQYLENAGDQLAGIKELLKQDDSLQELLQSPLTLSIITLAYQGKTVEELPQSGSVEVRRQHLFNTYVERMFKRKRGKQKYSDTQIKKWLSWLANKMSSSSQSVFLIEQIQPTWLQTAIQRYSYRLGSTLFATFVIISILVLGMLFDVNNPKVNHDNIILLNSVAWIIVLWIMFGQDKKIETFESLTLPWKKSPKDLLRGFKLGLFWGIILTPFAIVWCVLTCLDGATTENVIASVFLGFILGIIIGVINAVKGDEIETKVVPNQGIKRSATNASIITISSWFLLISIMFTLFPMGIRSITSAITWGLILGLLFGGGMSVVQHFCLRFLIWMKGFLPITLVDFLDYSVDRIFLQKVGGGYIFVHRMLLEHFRDIK